MKIYIKHIPNTYNYGSLMMAVNTLKYINDNFKDIEFFVDCQSEEDLNRLKIETGITEINFAFDFSKKVTHSIPKIMKRIMISRMESKFYDCKIILGGDDISEYYGKNNWLFRFPIMYIDNISLPTILLGQTIGPFTSYRRLLAKMVLNKASVYTRDDKCLEYIKKLGIKTAKRGRDLAFLELPLQSKAKGVLKKYSLDNKGYIVMVISGLTKCYTNSYEHYLEEQYNIIRGLIVNPKLDDKKIVLLAHVKDKGTADRLVIEDIEKKLTKTQKDKIVIIKEDMLASEAREILGNGLFTITGRMHAAVSTFYMRKPAISLSYSVKYEGVIGSGLDMNELVIECSDEKLWATSNVSKQVAEKVDYVLEHYEKLIYKIDKNVAKTSEMSIKQLETVVGEIRTILGKRRKRR